MTKDEFLEALGEKVKKATQGWPDWKHNVLRDSFRSTNSKERPAVVEKRQLTDSAVETIGTEK